MLVLKGIRVLELGTDVEHYCLGSCWNFDQIGIDVKFNWARRVTFDRIVTLHALDCWLTDGRGSGEEHKLNIEVVIA